MTKFLIYSSILLFYKKSQTHEWNDLEKRFEYISKWSK